MNEQLIGGHIGLDVYRRNGSIEKIAQDDINREALVNEARLLRILDGIPYAPKLIAENPESITVEDAGFSLRDSLDNKKIIVNDGERFRRNCAKMLAAFRKLGIRNGDLTPPNIVIRTGDVPCAIDWQQSHLFSEPFPDERHKLSDSFLLWRTVQRIGSELQLTPDSPRIIRRWFAIMQDLGGSTGVDNLVGKRLLDLGCFMGDFCGMAAADGMIAHGFDTGGFNSEIDSIDEAESIWGELASFQKRNIMSITDTELDEHDVVLLLSTWQYIFNDYGREAAYDLLDRIVKHSGRLYFETQLAGDGPGPEFLAWEGDVIGMLSQFGNVMPIVTIPVTGREATRTVYRVEK